MFKYTYEYHVCALPDLRELWTAWYEFLELNPGPLQVQQALLTNWPFIRALGNILEGIIKMVNYLIHFYSLNK